MAVSQLGTQRRLVPPVVRHAIGFVSDTIPKRNMDGGIAAPAYENTGSASS